MPYFMPSAAAMPEDPLRGPNTVSGNTGEDEQARRQRILIKNRRKRYLDTHPEYFGPSLELAGTRHASLVLRGVHCIGY